jgi:hypothetical protein
VSFDDKVKAKKKAEQLMALACSTTFTEEARTAAVAAVQIIRAYGLELSVNGVHAQSPPQPNWPPWNPPPRQPPPPQPPPRQRTGGFWDDIAGAPTYRPKFGEGKWIRSKYGGVCVACFNRFAVEDWILWHPDKGCMCRACVERKTGQ